MLPLPKRSARIDQFEPQRGQEAGDEPRKLPPTRPPPQRASRGAVPAHRPTVPSTPSHRPVQGAGRKGVSALFFQTTPAPANEDEDVVPAGSQDHTARVHERLRGPTLQSVVGRVPSPFPASRRSEMPPPRDEEQTQVRPDLAAHVLSGRRSSAPPPPPEPEPPSYRADSNTLVGPPRATYRMPPPGFAQPQYAVPMTYPSAAYQPPPQGYAYPYFASSRPVAPTPTSVPAPPPPSSVAPVAMSIPATPVSIHEADRLAATAHLLKKPSRMARDGEKSGHPTLSWVALFVALGMLGGLAIALFVRGDGEAVMDGMARLIDGPQAPAVGSAAAGWVAPGASAMAVQPVPYAPPRASAPVPVTMPAPVPVPPPAQLQATAPAPVASAPAPYAQGSFGQGPVAPVPNYPAGAVWQSATPPILGVVKSDAAPRPRPPARVERAQHAKGDSDSSSAKSDSDAAPAPKVVSKRKKGRASKDDDKEKEKSAAEAASDLANQQLEQSLAP